MKNLKNLGIAQCALLLRIGLGLTLLSGGLAKLGKLLFAATHEGMVANYMSSSGYINQFFVDYLFSSGWVSPGFFLTALSAFEFIAGLALITGIAVRSVSFMFGAMFWSFIIALPVTTTPGIEVSLKTYQSPAMLVMIRDIALSGMLFVLYNLGSGPYSLQKKFSFLPEFRPRVNWDHLGLLLRYSIGAVFIVGGAFAGMDHIKSFAHPALLLLIGIVIVSGNGTKLAGYAASLVLMWYIVTHVSLDKSIIGNLNGIKREIPLLAGAFVLGQLGGGMLFTVTGKIQEIKGMFQSKAPAA